MRSFCLGERFRCGRVPPAPAPLAIRFLIVRRPRRASEPSAAPAPRPGVVCACVRVRCVHAASGEHAGRLASATLAFRYAARRGRAAVSCAAPAAPYRQARGRVCVVAPRPTRRPAPLCSWPCADNRLRAPRTQAACVCNDLVEADYVLGARGSRRTVRGEPRSALHTARSLPDALACAAAAALARARAMLLCVHLRS